MHDESRIPTAQVQVPGDTVLLVGHEPDQERAGLDGTDRGQRTQPGPASSYGHGIQLGCPAVPGVELDEVFRQRNTNGVEACVETSQQVDVVGVGLSPIAQPSEAAESVNYRRHAVERVPLVGVPAWAVDPEICCAPGRRQLD